jgi:hypothetical protein
LEQHIRRDVAAGESFILIDGETFGGTVGAGRLRLPFLEKDGRYWGTASDDQHAITELERLRATGRGSGEAAS